MRGNLYGLESNSGMICRDHNCRKESEEGKGSFKKDGENKMEGSIYSQHNQSRNITIRSLAPDNAPLIGLNAQISWDA
jgi:hypothetical protein